ncbi:succinyl-diaminopimelate desuccinylase [Buchnera aphidicola]|uniref:succinyl-diaminopimelate desuccinylase n=1 Tax=Buchnera aphidicola TaxID=9 RepID=UPI002093EB92|nr:succinyl-diaminopimelate desuccinylase [Buchnera aphidicola]USS94196.1 succinyl-diaminopimelate desuccinylase [Buchnera aphidicola (Sipha maydis)]
MLNSIINLSKELIKIPSISPLDLGCQEILAQKLKKIGFIIENIKINRTSNLWAYKGHGKTLTFVGHTDVVPAGNIKKWKIHPFQPIVINDYLFGRGSADMKGSISAMICATENFLKKYNFHKGRISFLLTSDEESRACDGTKKIVQILKKRKEKINYCLVGEPTSNKILGDCIKNGRRGSLSAVITIYGIQGHIAYPNLAENPIHKSIVFIKKLINLELDRGNDYFKPSCLQIFFISSGKLNITNMIPDSIKIGLNIRYTPEIKKKNIVLKIEEMLKKNSLKNKISWFFSGDPFLTSSGKLLQVTKSSIQKILKISPYLSTSGGTSDGRFFPLLKSEIIELGPVNKTIHKINECVKVQDLYLLSKIYENILKKLFL